MTIDWRAQLFDVSYSTFGVPATLTTVDAFSADVTVIDKTEASATEPGSIGQGLGMLTIETVKPLALVRAYELAAKGVDKDVVDGATIAFNGKTWTVNAHGSRPAPTGEADGEIALFLILKRVG